jgi:F-type H+-transporting ATPase subunit a
MMPPQLVLTRFLNHHFAQQVDSLLAAAHIHPAHPHAPITNELAMELLIFAALLIYFVAVRISLSVEKPGVVQHFAEMANEFVGSQSESIIGHGYERFVSYLTVLVLFILLGNLMGLVPGMISPTANVVVPLGFALVTFVYYHYHGLRANGFGYFKQFLGPVWWLYPLMLPIEIISHCARVLSLTVRLYANMFAGDLVTLAFFSLIPIGVPLIFLSLHLGVALIQAYIFMVLACVYFSMAISHDH